MRDQAPPQRARKGRRTGKPPVPAAGLEFRQLLDKLPAGAYMCDPDGLITYYNRRAVEMWGQEPALGDPMDRY